MVAWAKSLMATAQRLFWDEENSCFFASVAADASLIVRKRELHDGAEPSGNGVMARNFVRMSHYEYNSELEQRMRNLFSTLAAAWARHPHAFSTSLTAYDLYVGVVKEVVIAGERDAEEVQKFVRELRAGFWPWVVLGWGGGADWGRCLGGAGDCAGESCWGGRRGEVLYLCEGGLRGAGGDGGRGAGVG